MRRWMIAFLVLVGLSFSVLAWAGPSDRVLHALENEIIRVTTNTDNSYQGELYAFDDEVVILLDDVANLKEIRRDSVEGIQLSSVAANTSSASTDAGAASGGSSGAEPTQSGHEQARANFLKEQRQLERTGSAYRISGGVITGVGALTAFSALMSLAIGGTHWSTVRTRDTLNKGAVITALVGTAMAGAGTGLIIAGNKKRRRAKAAYGKSFDYSLSPQFHGRGGGAELKLQF